MAGESTFSMNCDVCGAELATHHLGNANTGEAYHLCKSCYELTTGPQQLAANRRFDEVLRTGKCDYCGAPPVGGSGGWSPLEEETYNLWCEHCRLDLVEFSNGPGKFQYGDYPFDDKAAQAKLEQALADREAAQEEFMQRKVAERKSRAN